jgi:hypothetical protein
MSTPVVIHQSTDNCRFGDTNVSFVVADSQFWFQMMTQSMILNVLWTRYEIGAWKV